LGKTPFDIAELIRKYLLKTATQEEEIALQQWLQEDENHQHILESFKEGEIIRQEFNYVDGIDLKVAWGAIEEKQREHLTGKHRNKRLQWLAYAASLVLLIGAVYIAQLYISSEHNRETKIQVSKAMVDIPAGTEKGILTLANGKKINLGGSKSIVEQLGGIKIEDREGNVVRYQADENVNAADVNELIVPKGATYSIVLEDGTQAWLNAGSVLKFPARFNGNERRVLLEGEGYFSVAADKSRPFFVTANGAEIHALGTAFNVQTYDNGFKTTLTEGAVKVTVAQQIQRLYPGEEASLENGKLIVRAADLEKTTAWRNGYFYFNGDDIATINAQLARWYDITVVYQAKPDNRQFTGTIKRNLTLLQACEVLKALTHMDYQLVDRKLIVMPKGGLLKENKTEN